MERELADKRVEPNSGLGRAYNYMLKRWDQLTLFLRKAGVPLDNNVCEQALRMAIRHRRSSPFYGSARRRARDLLMSLIHTAQLRAENRFEYLTPCCRTRRRPLTRLPTGWPGLTAPRSRAPQLPRATPPRQVRRKLPDPRRTAISGQHRFRL
jgi:hypothetical protein